MRPRKYIPSGRAAPSNSAASAQVIPLRAAAARGYRPNAAEPARSKAQSGHRKRNDLNTQLSLERQRLTADDLQNVLCSTDVAIILLDADLTIRFFTPATKLLFDVIPGDIGRPLTDLSSLASEAALVSDARKVLQSLEPIEREIETLSGAWYVRRILPYRAEGQGIEGIIITFADISHQKQAAAALECARVRADSANVAKSRFLAAASHDLRQPLQTLVLLQELLAKVVVGEKAKKLIGRLDRTLGSMSGMLNALLDINQIEAGTVCAEFETFRIDALLDRVTADLACQAEAQQSVPMAVEVMMAGASDPLEKPLPGVELLAGVARALELSRDSGKLTESRKDAADHLASLTRRQHQIMEMVLAGHPSKNIAADLGISQRTVENHRASIMKKTGSRSLPALARLAFAAACDPEARPISHTRLNFLFA
jgi:signal transduction histidine kinase